MQVEERVTDLEHVVRYVEAQLISLQTRLPPLQLNGNPQPAHPSRGAPVTVLPTADETFSVPQRGQAHLTPSASSPPPPPPALTHTVALSSSTSSHITTITTTSLSSSATASTVAEAQQIHSTIAAPAASAEKEDEERDVPSRYETQRGRSLATTTPQVAVSTLSSSPSSSSASSVHAFRDVKEERPLACRVADVRLVVLQTEEKPSTHPLASLVKDGDLAVSLSEVCGENTNSVESFPRWLPILQAAVLDAVTPLIQQEVRRGLAQLREEMTNMVVEACTGQRKLPPQEEEEETTTTGQKNSKDALHRAAPHTCSSGSSRSPPRSDSVDSLDALLATPSPDHHHIVATGQSVAPASLKVSPSYATTAAPLSSQSASKALVVRSEGVLQATTSTTGDGGVRDGAIQRWEAEINRLLDGQYELRRQLRQCSSDLHSLQAEQAEQYSTLCQQVVDRMAQQDAQQRVKLEQLRREVQLVWPATLQQRWKEDVHAVLAMGTSPSAVNAKDRVTSVAVRKAEDANPVHQGQERLDSLAAQIHQVQLVVADLLAKREKSVKNGEPHSGITASESSTSSSSSSSSSAKVSAAPEQLKEALSNMETSVQRRLHALHGSVQEQLKGMEHYVFSSITEAVREEVRGSLQHLQQSVRTTQDVCHALSEKQDRSVKQLYLALKEQQSLCEDSILRLRSSPPPAATTVSPVTSTAALRSIDDRLHVLREELSDVYARLDVVEGALLRTTQQSPSPPRGREKLSEMPPPAASFPPQRPLFFLSESNQAARDGALRRSPAQHPLQQPQQQQEYVMPHPSLPAHTSPPPPTFPSSSALMSAPSAQPVLVEVRKRNEEEEEEENEEEVVEVDGDTQPPSPVVPPVTESWSAVGPPHKHTSPVQAPGERRSVSFAEESGPLPVVSTPGGSSPFPPQQSSPPMHTDHSQSKRRSTVLLSSTLISPRTSVTPPRL